MPFGYGKITMSYVKLSEQKRAIRRFE